MRCCRNAKLRSRRIASPYQISLSAFHAEEKLPAEPIVLRSQGLRRRLHRCFRKNGLWISRASVMDTPIEIGGRYGTCLFGVRMERYVDSYADPVRATTYMKAPGCLRC